ncbi:MAG: Glutamyl-tRNA(Gln) amidotransferase subunit A [Alphaproteobacteria bacterium MarineAlpha5_Bin11]|nr:Asp-tRNA(Asn)/Glu-tRNA(Gln) amidotransferase GatCAB subunit A [Pelagibacteraceae bacterium]PPR42884.1 MAG: Glutamyl-tRNA(Gln) amidotransferase subunit A [Alphaproteobacteria bacterium MarineAlpha5_Bin11]|tara:strand:- start:13513 stop:14949 length:1437 start_codon:yes stop_codon:yes gene_type:complete
MENEFSSIDKLLKLLKENKISVTEISKHFIDKIKKSEIKAFIHFNEDNILDNAKKLDDLKSKGTFKRIHGIPIGVKDLFCTKNIRTTAGSKILKNFIPTYESTVTSNLLNEGALFVGKTNLDEFAMGSSTTTSYFGSTINPCSKDKNKKLVAGGSSGGSAAAVSANLCLGATGTDTGGSIRQPASFCGVIGIKPTYGLCSRWGIIAFASSLDQAGVFSNNVKDASILLEIMAGYDNKDSTSANIKIPEYSKNLSSNIKGKKIGIPKEYDTENIPEDIKINWMNSKDYLQKNGAEIISISLPHTKFALPTYYILAPAEASSNLARYDGVKYGFRSKINDSLDAMYEVTRNEGFGAEVKRRILIGTYVLSAGYYEAYYLKAQKIRSLISNDFKEAFNKCDAILTPTSPSEAFPIGEKEDDPIKMYLNDIFTVPASLAGLPGISIPFGNSNNGLPLGIQIIGRHFDEQTILNISNNLEETI